MEVTENDIKNALQQTAPWKAPGIDSLPIGFLRACGRPLSQIIAKLANTSFQLSYFPSQFKQVGMVVIPKPGKSTTKLQSTGRWRPISLLNTIRKILKTVMG